MRVWTGPQAVRDLSIPDQRRQMMDYCKKRGWTVVREFAEAKSGTDDKRPQLQEMLDFADSGSALFDVILVHSYSRFSRDAFSLELHIRTLAKHGIQLISITQEVEDNAAGDFARRVIALFDEHNSKETSKHVSRSMRENARQGFLNGSVPPFGYVAIEVEHRGNTAKKRLAVEPVQAATVRLIFDLFQKGDGRSGPMGVKKVTEWLNENGHRTRKGARWGIGPIHKMLTDPTYKGERWFNRDGPEEDRLIVPVPPIIDPATFDAVQRSLRSRNPKMTPPRVVSGPILLTGLATCASCGQGMLLRTGKSGRYRYYTCGTRARQGKPACKGRTIPMPDLDKLVTDRIVDDLLTRDRMRALLEGLLKRQSTREQDQAKTLAALRDKLNDAEARLRQLYQAIEDGVADLSDPTLRERIMAAKTERDITRVANEGAAAELSPKARITEEKLGAFIELMRENITQGSIEFRRSYLRAVIDNVEVGDDQIRIAGRKSELLRAVTEPQPAATAVPTYVRRWRRRWDSNPRCACAHAGFQDRCVRPLRHSSGPAPR